jgi:type I restriction enzyme S subunit
MRSNYKPLGRYIQSVDIRNTDLKVQTLLGVSIRKVLMPSIANVIGTDMKTYKKIKKNQFAYGPVTSRNGDKISVAILDEYEEAIVSQAYVVFEVIDFNELDPEYLMMWFRRPEFDRYARFKSHGSAREIFDWAEMCETELPIPSIEKQREIVAEYNAVINRIKLNEQLSQKLEETAQALYKHWFVDFEFPSEALAKDGVSQPYKSSGGKMVFNEELDKEIPEGWECEVLSNKAIKIGSGSTPRGGKEGYKESGISLIRSLNVHDFNFVDKDLAFIDSKQAEKLKNVEVSENDILLNITGASVARCCIVPKRILPARVNQHVAIIRLKEQFEHYLLCALCSTDYKRRLLGVSESGSTREAITKDDIENFSMLFPATDTLVIFEKRIKPLFEHRYGLSEEVESLVKIKHLILSKMTKVEQEKELLNQN